MWSLPSGLPLLSHNFSLVHNLVWVYLRIHVIFSNPYGHEIELITTDPAGLRASHCVTVTPEMNVLNIRGDFLTASTGNTCRLHRAIDLQWNLILVSTRYTKIISIQCFDNSFSMLLLSHDVLLSTQAFLQTQAIYLTKNLHFYTATSCQRSIERNSLSFLLGILTAGRLLSMHLVNKVVSL